LIDGLLRCGFQRVEATSMVHPERVPQLADAEAVIEALHDRLDRLRVLVPNRRGLERALNAGVRNVAVTVAATEGYNEHNLNRSVRETLSEIELMSELVGGRDVRLDASISVAFGCPYEGDVRRERVFEVADSLHSVGIIEIALADTIGIANPAQVEEVFQAAREVMPKVRWGAHFHDTRGMGLANVLAALEAGIQLFEGSFGGIGGSPFAPGASGNICSEDALYMLEAMGIETGIDVSALIEVARHAEIVLGGRMPGKLYRLTEAEAPKGRVSA
jgi:hydroxymethylglutaryl-CoA lyase